MSKVRHHFHNILFQAESTACVIFDVILECLDVLLSKIRLLEEGTRKAALELSDTPRNEVM
jgi:hypothetical protein